MRGRSRKRPPWYPWWMSCRLDAERLFISVLSKNIFESTLYSRREPEKVAKKAVKAATTLSPQQRHAPAQCGGSTGPTRRPRITGAVPSWRKSDAAEPKVKLRPPHQHQPGITGNATLQLPVPVPWAQQLEGEKVTIATTAVNARGHRQISCGGKGSVRDDDLYRYLPTTVPPCRKHVEDRGMHHNPSKTSAAAFRILCAHRGTAHRSRGQRRARTRY